MDKLEISYNDLLDGIKSYLLEITEDENTQLKLTTISDYYSKYLEQNKICQHTKIKSSKGIKKIFQFKLFMKSKRKKSDEINSKSIIDIMLYLDNKNIISKYNIDQLFHFIEILNNEKLHSLYHKHENLLKNYKDENVLLTIKHTINKDVKEVISRGISLKWRKLGRELNNNPEILEEIEIQYKDKGHSVCAEKMLDYFEQSYNKSDINEVLCEALIRTHRKDLAEKIQSMLQSPE